MNDIERTPDADRDLVDRLRAYADDLAARRDPHGVAADVITSSRQSTPARWVALVVGVSVLVALLAALQLRAFLPVGADGSPPGTVGRAADALFDETSACDVILGGYSVTVTYPAGWFAAGATEVGCTWFGAQPIELAEPIASRPEGVAISLGAVPAPPIIGDPDPTTGSVAGHPWTRRNETMTEAGNQVRHLVYYIVLDPAEGEPTMVASTSTDSPGDGELNVAVLDRLVPRLRFNGPSARDIYLPTYRPMAVVPEAQIGGTLIADGGCLWIEHDEGRALALWPSSSHIERDGTTLIVVNSGGARAQLGTEVIGGGGEYRPEHYDFVVELIGEEVPAECRGDDVYVLVYDVRTTGN